MFGITWSNFIRLLIWTGIINKPKGEGEWFRVDLGVDLRKMDKKIRKVWQSVFKGTDFCAEESDEFEGLMEDGTVRINKMDGVLFYKLKKLASGSKNALVLDHYRDVTERVTDIEQRSHRLKVARGEEREALDNCDEGLALEKKMLVRQLESELRGERLYNLELFDACMPLGLSQ